MTDAVLNTELVAHVTVASMMAVAGMLFPGNVA